MARSQYLMTRQAVVPRNGKGAHSFHSGVAARPEGEADVRQLLEVVRLHDLKRRLRPARQQNRLEPASSPQLAEAKGRFLWRRGLPTRSCASVLQLPSPGCSNVLITEEAGSSAASSLARLYGARHRCVEGSRIPHLWSGMHCDAPGWVLNACGNALLQQADQLGREAAEVHQDALLRLQRAEVLLADLQAVQEGQVRLVQQVHPERLLSTQLTCDLRWACSCLNGSISKLFEAVATYSSRHLEFSIRRLRD